MASAQGWWKAVFAVALAALVGAWFRHREPEIVDEAAPGNAQWPPLTPLVGDDPLPQAIPAVAPTGRIPAESVPPSPDRSWVAPDDEGNCPLSHPVKVKEASGIHHVPGGFSYERTNADRCYATGEDAESDGFRAAKR